MRSFEFQLTVLLACRLVEPISFTVLFPFVNSMVEDLLPDLPKSSVGRYSGALESVFYLSSLLCMYNWGKLSDRVGRRPIMMCGLMGLSFSMIMFGLSSSIWWAMAARIMTGALCGNASVLRAALGEITDASNEGWVYPLWSISWDLSIIIGPLIGSTLSNPAKQYPNSWFGQIPLFKTFPYLPPCLFVAALAWISLLMAALLFEETLGASKKDEIREPDENTSLLSGSDDEAAKREVAEEMGIFKLLQIPAVKHVLISNFLMCFIALSFDVGFILFAYSEPKLGGIGLSPNSIANCLSLRGASSIVLSLLVFPIAKRKFGTQPLYRFFTACWVPLFAILPVMNAMVSKDDTKWVVDGSLTGLWWIMAPTMLVYTLADLGFPLNMLALNASAPSPAVLGALNGLSLSVGSLSRSMGPATLGWLYSVSVERRFPIVWLAHASVAMVATVQAWWVKGRAEQKVREDETDGRAYT